MSRELPSWLVDWLEGDWLGGGNGARWRVVTDWPWEPWFTVTIVALAILWTVGFYLRERGLTRFWHRATLAALRIAALGLVFVMLAKLAVVTELTEPPGLAIVIDRSASMGVVDLTAEPKSEPAAANPRTGGDLMRLDQVKRFLSDQDRSLLETLARRYSLELYGVGADLESIAVESSSPIQIADSLDELRADGPGSDLSRLGDALQRLAQNSAARPAAILIFTDGVTTAGLSLADGAAALARRGIPLLAIGVGSEEGPRDLEVADLIVDDAVFVDDVVTFQALVKATGMIGERARITLRREGADDPLAMEEFVIAPEGETRSVQLTDRPGEAGEATYVVEVAAIGKELNRENNVARRSVEVRDDKIRVLLAFAYPSYEFRFLKMLLERETSIELSTYLQEADPDYSEQDRTALRILRFDRSELSHYDVVLLGDLNPLLVPVSFWSDLADAVIKRGRGVAFIAGPRYFPWQYRNNSEVATLVPFELQSIESTAPRDLVEEVREGFQVRPTPLGLQNGAFQIGRSSAETEAEWRALAPMYWLAEIDRWKPAAQVLAVGRSGQLPEQGNIPVIVAQFVGRGRSLFHGIDSTWRWRKGTGEAAFARYWVQSIRQLARGILNSRDGVELLADRREYREGEFPTLRARVFDPLIGAGLEEVALLLKSPGQLDRRIVLPRWGADANAYQSTIPGLTAAEYEAVLIEPRMPEGSPSVSFEVVTAPGELARTAMDRRSLEEAAARTEGRFMLLSEAENLLDAIPAGSARPARSLPPVAIWKKWWMLSALLVLLTSEWVLRKLWGLL